jgi:hypothetical protein
LEHLFVARTISEQEREEIRALVLDLGGVLIDEYE